MVADVNIKDYYLQFIHDAEADAEEYKNELETVLKVKETVYEYLDINKDILKNTYNIDITTFDKEWNDKQYNKSETLYNLLIKLITVIKEDKEKEVLLQAIKYCNILRKENNYKRLIVLTTKRKNLTFKAYRKYVSDYYIKVHKCLLNGMGYRFGNGIGTFIINYWKMDPTKTKYKNRIDFNATNKRKKELLAEGKRLYDPKEADWYAARGIPYDGVDYRVYKNDTSYYEFTIIKSNIFRKDLEYKRVEYLNAKFRGMSYQQIADEYVKDIEDIYSLQLDIKFKLNILLYKDPTKYLNFIRNVEQVKYKHRAYNCQD